MFFKKNKIEPCTELEEYYKNPRIEIPPLKPEKTEEKIIIKYDEDEIDLDEFNNYLHFVGEFSEKELKKLVKRNEFKDGDIVLNSTRRRSEIFVGGKLVEIGDTL